MELPPGRLSWFGMRGRLALLLSFLGLALAGALLAWVLVVSDAFEGLGPIWPWVVGGALLVAALTGGLMWLAFYSSRRGFDDLDRRV